MVGGVGGALGNRAPILMQLFAVKYLQLSSKILAIVLAPKVRPNSSLGKYTEATRAQTGDDER